MSDPGLLLLDEPTDSARRRRLAPRSANWPALAKPRRQVGLGVLGGVASELPELIGLCDRIIVMRAGCTIHEFGPGASEDAVRQQVSEGGRTLAA